jgi:hypothetical protein
MVLVPAKLLHFHFDSVAKYLLIEVVGDFRVS